MNAIRPAAVAGTFYPADPLKLGRMVEGFLARAEGMGLDRLVPPKALIGPHAGYVYSGATAGTGYAGLKSARDRITRVLILGPCHRVPVNGLALSGMDAFETPLGRVPVDKDASAAILDLPQVSVFEATHEQEHGLEVHLPFLQTVLGEFAIVPLVVGSATPAEVAEALERLWGGEETLIVISTDLSHFLDYDAARALDARTAAAIEAFEPGRFEDNSACGRFPLAGFLMLAKERGLSIRRLELCNSGDTAGAKDRVVGYGSWVLHDHGDGTPASKADTSEMEGGAYAATDGAGDVEAGLRALVAEHGGRLLTLAARAVASALKTGKPAHANLANLPPSLHEQGAVFVTLKTADGALRGCVGSVEAHRALAEDVVANAQRAAFNDPRFPALTAGETEGLILSVSVLSPRVPFPVADEADLLAKLRPGVDGLVISDQGRRALFLPSVWRQLPDPKQFLLHLKRKAGLALDHWSETFTAERFIAVEASSATLRGKDLEEWVRLWHM